MLGTEADGTIGVRLADGQINYHDKKGQEYIARNTALEFLERNGTGISFSIIEDGKLKKRNGQWKQPDLLLQSKGKLEEVKDWLRHDKNRYG